MSKFNESMQNVSLSNVTEGVLLRVSANHQISISTILISVSSYHKLPLIIIAGFCKLICTNLQIMKLHESTKYQYKNEFFKIRFEKSNLNS